MPSTTTPSMSREMFEEWAKRDPLERFRDWLRENAR